MSKLASGTAKDQPQPTAVPLNRAFRSRWAKFQIRLR